MSAVTIVDAPCGPLPADRARPGAHTNGLAHSGAQRLSPAAALEQVCEQLATEPDHDLSRLRQAARKMGRFVTDGALGEMTCYRALLSASVINGSYVAPGAPLRIHRAITDGLASPADAAHEPVVSRAPAPASAAQTAVLGADPLALTRHAGPDGITARQFAASMLNGETPQRSDIECARRRLAGLVAAGELRCMPGRSGGAGGGTHSRWYAADVVHAGVNETVNGRKS